MSLIAMDSLMRSRNNRHKKYLDQSSQQQLYVQMVKNNSTNETNRGNQLRRKLANPESQRQIINVVSQTESRRMGKSPRSRGINVISKSKQKKVQIKEAEHSAYISPPFFTCCEEEIQQVNQSNPRHQTKKKEKAGPSMQQPQSDRIEPAETKPLSHSPQTYKIEQAQLVVREKKTQIIEHPVLPPNEPLNKRQKQQTQECSVCCLAYNSKEMKVFGRCGHKYCTICLHKHIENTINSFKQVKCLHEKCTQMLNMSSPHIKSLKKPVQQRYSRIITTLKSLKNPDNRVCPSENCQGFINLSNKRALCAICKIQFCKQCLYPIHSGNCDKNGATYMIDKFSFKRCPSCRMIIERNGGCDLMQCRCGYLYYDQPEPSIFHTLKNGILAIVLGFLIALVHVLMFQYVYPIFMCIIVPIIATFFYIFYSIGLGIKEMINKEKCWAIIVFNFVLIFIYSLKIFLEKIYDFFKHRYFNSSFLQLDCLFPMSYILYHEMKACMF